MKKILSLFCILIMTIILIGCEYEDVDLSIKSKEPTTIPIINGQWIVDKYKTLGKSSDINESYNVWNKSIITINTQVAIFPNNTYKNPKYKLKVVEAYKYIYDKYGVDPKSIGINSEMINVVSVSSDEHYYEEVILIDDNNGIVENNNILYYISKIDHDDIEALKEKQNQRGISVGNYQYSNKPDLAIDKSGVLIGLKETSKSKEYPEIFEGYSDKLNLYTYRTLWISFDGVKVDVQEVPDIFLVRKNGFWKVKNDRVITENSVKDNILVTPLIKKEDESESLGKTINAKSETYSTTEINFISNDYVSIENHGNDVDYKDESYDYENIETIPIDTLYTGEMKPISISKICDKQQLEIINEKINTITNKEYENKGENISDFWGFGVERIPGKWILKGRVSQYGSYNDYADFQMPIDVPPSLLKYDSVYLPLAKVREQIPKAQDVICSPNKDMAVIFTQDKMLVYSIVGMNLSDKPLKEIELKKGETMIMSEWATGEYVDYWSKEVSEQLKAYSNK